MSRIPELHGVTIPIELDPEDPRTDRVARWAAATGMKVRVCRRCGEATIAARRGGPIKAICSACLNG